MTTLRSLYEKTGSNAKPPALRFRTQPWNQERQCRNLPKTI